MEKIQKDVSYKEKIYLDDEPLNDAAYDNFEIQQVAEILRDSIIQSNFPLHISLLGKWGSGKTTTIKILKNILDKDYKLEIISVWKFADDSASLHRKIVREVENNLGIKNPEGLDEEKSSSSTVKSTGPLSSLLMMGKMKNFRSILFWAPLVVVLILILSLFLPMKFQFLSNNVLIISALSFFIYLLRKETGVIAERVDSITPLALKHSDQYEKRFQLAVDKYLGKDKNKKLILVFDDLDRLPPKQLYGALNTIKTFLNYERCAFIIPCDEEVLRNELGQAFGSKDMKSFEVNEYLNKAFDVTIRLPKLERTNMIKYARDLLIENNIFWYKENKEKINEILFVLIHSDVSTPRHVKKILNAFSTDWKLATKRDRKNKNGIYLTKFPETLALFTVLKTDFSNFYVKLSEKPTDLFYHLEIEDEYDKNDSLKAFLQRVEKLIPDDVRPYIYFNNQELNPLTGRSDLQEVKEIILNGQRDKFGEIYKDFSVQDMNLVLSSTLQDIQASLAVDNLFSIIFNFPEITKKMDKEQRILLEELINYNVIKTTEFNIKNTLEIFKDLIDYEKVWSVYEDELLRKQDRYLEVFQTHIDYPELFTRFNINNFTKLYSDNVINIGQQSNDSYYVSKQIINLDKNHPLCSKIKWYESLKAVLHYYNDEEEAIEGENDTLINFNLSQWLQNILEKTNETITVKQINNILEIYDFQEYESLDGIIGIWMQQYRLDSEDEDIKKLLSMIKENYTYFASLDEINDLGNLLVLNEDVLEEELESLLYSSLKTKNEEALIALLQSTRTTNKALEFSIENIRFDASKLDESYSEIIASGDANLNVDRLNKLISKVSTNVFGQGKNASVDGFLNMLINSDVIHQKTIEQRANWFNDNFAWFKWNGKDEQYYKMGELYIEIYKDKDPWKAITDNITSIVARSNNISQLGNYPYRQNWSDLINSLVKLMLDKNIDESNWDYFVRKTDNIQIINSAAKISVFTCLNKSLIDKFFNLVPNVISLDNEVFNRLITKYANVDNSTHLSHIIARWNYFTLNQRIDLTSKLDSENLLIEHIRENPELKYIDEIGDYAIEDESKELIVRNIVSRINNKILEQWLASSLVKFNEQEINYWTKRALLRLIEERNDISLPEPSILEPLFKYKDDRTEILIKIIINLLPFKNRNNKKFKEIKESILLLEDQEKFRELVLEAKKKFRWRNTILNR